MSKRVWAKIESMAFKGYGVSKADKKVVFVPHSVIGDEGWIEITKDKKNYSFGKFLEVLIPSSRRAEPPCPYFGRCGGCQWQHIDYARQVELKKKILEDILMRLGRQKQIPPITVHPSSHPYHYRIRVQLKVKGDKLGYYEERSHQLIDIEKCLIAHPLLNDILLSLRKEPSLLTTPKEIEINVSPEEGKGVLIFTCPKTSENWDMLLAEFFKSTPILKGIVTLGGNDATSLGDPHLNFTIPFNLTLRTSPGSFFQVNLEQNESLIQKVTGFSQGKRNERALDLYSGVGNFTLPLAKMTREIWGIEENTVAVTDARYNAHVNKIETASFIRGKVEEVLIKWKKRKPDLVILDPPRTGAKGIIDQLARLNPKRTVYVSCEPTTFGRDLRLFSEKGYILSELSLIDMFPQTYHMEVVGLLNRS